MPNNEYEEDSLISSPEFVDALDREKIVPWKTFINYDDFLLDCAGIGDIETKKILRLVEKYGICHLRIAGQDPGESTFRAVFESFGQIMPEQNRFVGEIKNIKPLPDIDPITGDSAGDLGFHLDGTQTPDQPTLLAFQYVVPADLGGNSRFLDLARIIFDLSPELAARLIVNLSQADTAVFVKSGMRLVSPIFHMPDGDSIACRIRIDNVIDVKEECKKDFELLREILLSEKYGIKLKPRPGDIIVFDNWRVSHARDTVLGNNQRHHRRVWMEALLPHYQADFRLGIRPISARIKAAIQENNGR